MGFNPRINWENGNCKKRSGRFVHIGEKEYVNPKYLSFEDHFKIVHLCKLVRENPDMTNQDLEELLNMCVGRFKILIDVHDEVPNLVDEIRHHDDEKYVSYLYFGLKQNKANNINI